MTTPIGPDLSKLPSMTALLNGAEHHAVLKEMSRSLVADALREALDSLRQRLQSGPSTHAMISVDALLAQAVAVIQSRRANRLVRVINATGVVLHTGLGRSVLADAAVDRIARAARGYCNLEIELPTGKRGRRGQYAADLLCRLTGAEAALIVNNNAAATMLVLHALAKGREVIVSRGQLIEIGGSYRLPEVMIAGGAVLREVGTTNKTHLRDYEVAIGDQTAMLMHVHTSNYRVVGFAEAPETPELAELAHRHGLLMFDDLGSGALLDDELWSAAAEPTVIASLRAGADVLSFSGDKLLGGPQVGILLGKREIIDKLRRDPMTRALRIDKLIIAALEATLELYLAPESVKEHLPLLRMLSEPLDSLKVRAGALAERLHKTLPGDAFAVAQDESFAGGGSLPAWPFPTTVVSWRPTPPASLDDLVRRLRLGAPAVLARIRDEAILFDLRTTAEWEYDDLAAAVAAAREPKEI